MSYVDEDCPGVDMCTGCRWHPLPPGETEVLWLDERIDIVREIAKQGLRGEMDPQLALATIVQQLQGVSRSK